MQKNEDNGFVESNLDQVRFAKENLQGVLNEIKDLTESAKWILTNNTWQAIQYVCTEAKMPEDIDGDEQMNILYNRIEAIAWLANDFMAKFGEVGQIKEKTTNETLSDVGAWTDALEAVVKIGLGKWKPCLSMKEIENVNA